MTTSDTEPPQLGLRTFGPRLLVHVVVLDGCIVSKENMSFEIPSTQVLIVESYLDTPASSRREPLVFSERVNINCAAVLAVGTRKFKPEATIAN